MNGGPAFDSHNNIAINEGRVAAHLYVYTYIVYRKVGKFNRQLHDRADYIVCI